MDETKLGTTQRRIPDYSGGSRNFVHDSNRTREYAAVSSVYWNDGDSSNVSSPRCVDKDYRIRVIAYSTGLFLSGILFTVIQLVR